jgi:hypothetical protein
VAITELLTRLHNIRIDPAAPPVERVPSYILRGVRRLDLLFESA